MQVSLLGRAFEVQDEPADFWGWVSEGRYDAEWRMLEKHLKPEHTFLDLGAWVGSHSLFASTICKRVVAVEPDPVAYGILSYNISRLKIEACSGAITNYNGVILLGSGLLGASTTRVNRNAGGGIGAWEEGQQFESLCMTLRSFVESSSLEDPLFIKMDVEGAEEEILQDYEFFAERRPTVYLEQHPFWWKDHAAVSESIKSLEALGILVGR